MFEVKQSPTGKYVVINTDTGYPVGDWRGRTFRTRSKKRAIRIRDRRNKWFEKLLTAN